MSQYRPASLPDVDEVEIVDLRGLNPDNVGSYMSLARESRVSTSKVPPELGQQIAGLFRQLADGEQTRCHLPHYGFRFYAGGDLVLEASLCWECNNAFGATAKSEIFFTFDASAGPSRALLALANNAVPERSSSGRPHT